MVSKSYSFEPEILIKNLPLKKEIARQFFKRVYSTPIHVYKERLSLIQFENKEMVLDAGCGFGQWSLGLSHLNKKIHSIDINQNLVMTTKKILELENKKNVSLYVGSIENLPFEDNSFDAIMCYSVIYQTNFKESIKEFYRILKPDGIIYIVANGFGWYLYNLLTGHSSASDFDARKHSLQTIFGSIEYYLTGKRKKNSSLILSPKLISKYMKSTGFKKIVYGAEGHIQLKNSIKPRPFYRKNFLQFTNVFEVWAMK